MKKPQYEYPSALADCQACPLLAQCGPPIPGDYRRKDWDILVVLRNPGTTERTREIPAIGKTGMMLRKYLHEAGLLPRCAFTNVVKCHTPGNRQPSEKELKACSHWVRLEAAEHSERVKLILCAGFEAAKWAGGFKGAIGSNVGQLRRTSAMMSNVPTYAIYHPSYIWRMRGKPEFRGLERQLRDNLAEVRYHVENQPATPAYPWQLAERIHAAGHYGVDTEYVGDQREGRLAVASFTFEGTPQIFITPQVEEISGTPVMHHAQADLVVLMRNAKVNPKYVDDTMVIAWHNGETELSLKRLAQKHLSADTMTYAEAESIGGWGTWMNYSAQDAYLTKALLPPLYSQLESVPGALWCYENIDRPLQLILARMSLTGIPIKHSQVLARLATARSIQQKLMDAIRGLAGYDLNPGSNEQVANWLYNKIGLLKPREHGDRKHPSVDKAHLNRLNTRETRLVLQYRAVQKLAGTYLQPLMELETLSGLWKITGTETGRLSCEKRNLTNLVLAVEEVLGVPEGMASIHGDYKSLELRIGAYLSRDPALLEYLSDPNADMHTDCCLEVYGRVDDGLRTRAKSALFERMYGGGPFMCSIILNISLNEAKHLFAWQDQHLAGFLRWAQAYIQVAFAQGYTETLQGQRRYLHDMDSEDEVVRHKAAKEAVNSPIQGTGGYFTKHAMVKLDAPLRSLGGLIWRQVHDSIDIWVPQNRIDEGKQLLELAMLDAVPDDFKATVPVYVDIRVGM